MDAAGRIADVQQGVTTSCPPLQTGCDRGRILIADDEEQVCRLIAELLQQEGYRCDCVGAAQETAKALAANVYDLLITDIHMPDNETLGFLQACQGGVSPVPVIVITGHPSVGTAVEAVRCSVVDYLVKPVDDAVLCRSVDRAIGQRRVLRALRKAREEMRIWGEAMHSLEQSLAASDSSDAGAKGARPTEHVWDQTMTLFRQIVTSLKVTLEATMSERSGQRNMDLCAAVGCRKLAVYEEALRRSVDVLVNTKNAFKSKEIGELRKMLVGILKKEAGC
jgi:FixJ family two-component response regulator